MPPLEDARELVGGLFEDLAPKISTEDAKKIRELVRNAGDPRRPPADAARGRERRPDRDRDPRRRSRRSTRSSARRPARRRARSRST